MKELIKNLISEFIYGGHLLSLGASFIVWSTLLLYGLNGGFYLLVLAYFTSQIVYNFDHLLDSKKENLNSKSERSVYLVIKDKQQTIMMIVYVLGFFLVANNTYFPAALLSGFLVFGGILYTLKFKYVTKSLLGFKNYYVAFLWSLLGLLVPLSYNLNPTSLFSISIVLFIFIRWVLNTTYFDIKDIDNDKLNNLKTLPVWIGLKNTLYFLHFINILSAILLTLLLSNGVFPIFSVTLVTFTIYSFCYLIVTEHLTKRQLRKLSYVVVDGEYLFWPVAIIMGKLVLS